MMTVIDANILPLIIALVIGLIIGWWMFRRTRARSGDKIGSNLRTGAVDRSAAEPPPPPVRPYMRNRPIRDGIDTEERKVTGMTGGAAAMTDVAGEVLGVDAHPLDPGESGPPDDLQTLKGVGPKLAQKLNENGITRFEQLAGLSSTEVAMLDQKLGPFKGRLERDRVVEQASYLARGDRDGFEARFGSLGGA
ncbi:MAG TPA: helix-hairpin-helix domain-containing protein [Allosphingosinicella sp.]|jgi:predicted flap endonuclease-1-like 5' DNA nuclease